MRLFTTAVQAVASSRRKIKNWFSASPIVNISRERVNGPLPNAAAPKQCFGPKHDQCDQKKTHGQGIKTAVRSPCRRSFNSVARIVRKPSLRECFHRSVGASAQPVRKPGWSLADDAMRCVAGGAPRSGRWTRRGPGPGGSCRPAGKGRHLERTF